MALSINDECAGEVTQIFNFGRIHQTLRCTPAVRAGVAGHVWPIEEIAGLLNFAEKSSN